MTNHINKKDECNRNKVFVILAYGHRPEFWKTKTEALKEYSKNGFRKSVEDFGYYIWVSDKFLKNIKFEK